MSLSLLFLKKRTHKVKPERSRRRVNITFLLRSVGGGRLIIFPPPRLRSDVLILADGPRQSAGASKHPHRVTQVSLTLTPHIWKLFRACAAAAASTLLPSAGFPGGRGGGAPVMM